jgi:acyl-CoA synthetase (NDP forming)
VLNPFDLTPETYNKQAWLDLLPQALDAIAADPEIHTIFFSLGALPHVAQALTDNILGLHRRSGKLVVVSWPLPPPGVVQRLAEAGLHTYSENGRALRAVGHAERYAAALSQDEGAPVAPLPAGSFDWRTAAGAVTAGTVISEHECHRLLALAGLPVAPGELATSRSQVARISAAVGCPVALKGISPAVTHRAAAGLVALGLATPEAAEAAYDAIMAGAAARGVDLDGVYVQHMVPGLEILVSAFRDPLFGTMISCGAGGTLTEVIDDIVLARGPMNQAAAHRLLSRLRILQHAGSQTPPPDAAPLAAFVAQFSQVAAAVPWQRFVLELNPVKWTAQGVTAVDGLLLIEQP